MPLTHPLRNTDLSFLSLAYNITFYYYLLDPIQIFLYPNVNSRRIVVCAVQPSTHHTDEKSSRIFLSYDKNWVLRLSKNLFHQILVTLNMIHLAGIIIVFHVCLFVDTKKRLPRMFQSGPPESPTQESVPPIRFSTPSNYRYKLPFYSRISRPKK